LQKYDHNIGFWEKHHFFAENWQKPQKIMIITSTPGLLFTDTFLYITTLSFITMMLENFPAIMEMIKTCFIYLPTHLRSGFASSGAKFCFKKRPLKFIIMMFENFSGVMEICKLDSRGQCYKELFFTILIIYLHIILTKNNVVSISLCLNCWISRHNKRDRFSRKY
jgi:hypothetical protein